MRLLSVTVCILGLQGLLPAQINLLSLDSASACPGDTVVLSIMAQNLNNIGAITLYVTYDSTTLKYVGHSNVHPATPGVLSNGMTFPTVQVGISWSASLSGANIGTAKFLDLIFIHKAGNCDLHFTSNCEIADYQANILSCTYIDGEVFQPLPVIVSQPGDTTLIWSQMTTLDMPVTVIGQVAYQWQGDSTGFDNWFDLVGNLYLSGVATSTLQIVNSGIGVTSLDNWRFRCRIEGCGVLHTIPAFLHIINDAGIYSPENRSFNIFPCPADESLNISYSNKQNSQAVALVSLISLRGDIIERRIIEISPDRTFKFVTEHLPDGLYFLRIQTMEAGEIEACQKVIISH